MQMSYRGYLSDHVELIRALHEGGASTWEIATALYNAGARAHRSSPHTGKMSRAEHLVNLRAMVIYVQRRLGLRHRRIRILNLKANQKNGGRRPGDETRRADSKRQMMKTGDCDVQIARGPYQPEG
jgi:hypothetical protein